MIDTYPHTTERPDGILFIIGYYLLLGIGFALFGGIMVSTALPESLAMMRGDSIFLTGTVALAMMAVGGIGLGAWMIRAARALWMGTEAGRGSTVVISGLMVAMSVLSVPALLYLMIDGDALMPMMMAVAAIIASASALSAWYLTRPAVRAYFVGDKAKRSDAV